MPAAADRSEPRRGGEKARRQALGEATAEEYSSGRVEYSAFRKEGRDRMRVARGRRFWEICDGRISPGSIYSAARGCFAVLNLTCALWILAADRFLSVFGIESSWMRAPRPS